ncbi:unnamed protein product [Allacma fusca]|uniref:Uncharacterized protein n=1 Tax=Allacma fusca TaxID=39272 RepID=A0A8J2PCE4_9HEXA|nr:unnamed protein product [Allacma fusca]
MDKLAYDQEKEVYVVKKCSSLQRICCVLVHLCFTFSAAQTLYVKGLDLIRNTAYIVAYFDFMNVCVLNVYIYSHLYIHWFRLDLAEAYVEVIQTSGVLKCCRTPTWKAVAVPAIICSVATHISWVWFVVVFQIDFSTTTSFWESAQVNARELFWYDRNAAVTPSLFLAGVAAVGRFYNAYYIHVTLNAFTHINMYTAYFIAKDYFGSLLTEKIHPKEALELLEEYKALMKKLNRYLTPYVLHFTVMTLTFHSVHLFDVLNTNVFIWKINMYLYLIYLVNFFLLPPTLLIRVR